MSNRTEKKIQEGLQNLEEAEKHLKTGFFKWRPDYDSAAASFQNAGLAFKLAKEYEKAFSTYERLADTHYKMGARFHAAKAYEEAGNACRELQDYSKALSYYDRAADMYLENGTADTAVLCLERAGKIVESINTEWSISLYMKAAEICQNEDESRFRQAAELVGKAARLQVQSGKLTEAANTIGHECQLYSQVEGGGESIPRLTCELVLVHLRIGDPVRAEQSIHQASDFSSNFEGSDEQDALLRLVDAFNNEDQDKANEVLHTPMFKFMDNCYAKIARYLTVPGYSTTSASDPTPQTVPATNYTPAKKDTPTKIIDQMTAVGEITDKMNSLTSTVPDVPGGGASSPRKPVDQPAVDEEEDDLC